MQSKQASYQAAKEPVTFGHQLSEIILGIQYFGSLSSDDKDKVVKVLYPVVLRFFKQRKLAANLVNAFALRSELQLFAGDALLGQESNYTEPPDSRTKTGKNIDNAVLGLHYLFGQYLGIRQAGRKSRNQEKNNTKSSFNRDEKQLLGMPESVAPIAISLLLLMLFYLVWVYFIKDKK